MGSIFYDLCKWNGTNWDLNLHNQQDSGNWSVVLPNPSCGSHATLDSKARCLFRVTNQDVGSGLKLCFNRSWGKTCEYEDSCIKNVIMIFLGVRDNVTGFYFCVILMHFAFRRVFWCPGFKVHCSLYMQSGSSHTQICCYGYYGVSIHYFTVFFQKPLFMELYVSYIRPFLLAGTRRGMCTLTDSGCPALC